VNKIRILEIETASRAQRRWMVCIMYAAFVFTGGYAHLRRPSDFLLILLSGLCCCGIYKIAGRQASPIGPADPDERNLRIRDRALSSAYFAVSGVVILASVFAPFAHLAGAYVLRILVFLIFTLPPSLIAWDEPDSPTEGAE
jgi:hypothetical protein